MGQTEQLKLQKLYNTFREINKKAYRHIYFLPSQVLSKHLHWGDALNRHFFKQKRQISPIEVFYNFLYSLGANCSAAFLMIFNKIAFDLSGLRACNNYLLNGKRTFIIDTFFLKNKILKEKRLNESYFPGLTDILTKMNVQFVFTPKWFGENNPLVNYKVFKTLKKQEFPLLAEYQVLKAIDYLKIFVFSVLYPLYIISLALSIRSSTQEKITIKYALFVSLRTSGVTAYSRYLYGRRIADSFSGKLRCISWYENQNIDKCFYKGLRTINPAVRIYGAQLFIKPSGLLGLSPDEKEVSFGIVPDIVLVNGSYYIPSTTNLYYRVGPSLRYKKVFERESDYKSSDSILVLLPYWTSECRHILNILIGIRAQYKRKILLKFHPTTDLQEFEKYFHHLKYTEKDLYELFLDSVAVIGSESGSLVEVIAMACPVIYIKNPKRYNHNPLPDIGRGKVWDIAVTGEDVEELLNRILNQKNNNMVEQYAKDYRQLLFNEPTEANIIKAFDL